MIRPARILSSMIHFPRSGNQKICMGIRIILEPESQVEFNGINSSGTEPVSGNILVHQNKSARCEFHETLSNGFIWNQGIIWNQLIPPKASFTYWGHASLLVPGPQNRTNNLAHWVRAEIHTNHFPDHQSGLGFEFHKFFVQERESEDWNGN